MNYILLSLLTLGIWISSASGLPKVETQNQPRTQGTIRVQDRPTFSHNATLHRRNNINKYGGCDKMYKDGKSKGKDIVKQGYHDMLRMTGLLNPFLTVVVDEQLIELDPGPMENRFLAVGKDDKSRAKRDLIYTIIQQSALWYPWYPFDWFGGRRIEVYCEVDQPNTGGSSCAKMENGMKTRAYAVNYKGKSQIVFCASYFIQPSLDERKAELDKTPDKTKDLTWMRTRAHTFFHEMSHLAVIEGRKLHVVKDLNQNPVGPSGKKVYGPKLVEALARDYPDYAYLNADNYAWYATAMWYRQFYGDPDSASITATAPEDDAVDYFEDDGSDPLPAEFDNPDYDEISEAEAIAFAAGDYTPSGWLKNKKLRILPLGDSITSGVQSSDGNGYRKDLLNILEGANNAVEMIGSMKTGNMADNAHEGHNGATIDQIATFTSAYTQRPNVILLHAGTYDLSLSVDPASAPQRLDSLVGKLVAACPDATIIVSRIIPSSNGGTASLIKPFNKAVAEFMAQRAVSGQHVMIVDMPSGVTTGDLADGLLPNDEGYNKMAVKWAIAITAADSIGWIKDPSSSGGSEDPGGSGPDAGQQIAIASYINPNADSAAWVRLLSYNSDKVSVLVANILNGPDYVLDKAWKSVIDQAASQGKKVIGYIRTGYLGVSHQQFTTRLGSHDLADWTSQIEQDVDKWYELYGSSLGGIFFDEGWPECGPNNIYADVYAYINNYTKRKYPGAFTVLNPGSPIAQCFENTMDTLLTFENSYEAYQSEYTPNDWTPKDPRKIWHIIFQVPQGQIAGVAALASSRHAGFVEITDDTQPNPYDNLPNEAYMQALIGAVAGGKPRAADPATFSGSYVAGLPADAAVSSSDYSSVTLTWSSVGSALGYAVYKNGVRVVELPPFMTRATIAMLEPGTSGMTFEVRTILATGSGGQSRSLSGSTKSLPSTGTVSNVGFTTDGNTATYKADVLVPYGFVRLFLGIKQPDPGIGRGWPIHSPALGGPSGETAFHQIVNYLVEGNSFYSGFSKYTGTWYELSPDNAEWSWESIGTAPQTQNGYTYTWTVPLAGTDAVASEYLIQCQGYAPLNNVFKGTLRHYGSV